MYLHTLEDWMNSGLSENALNFRRAYLCRLDDILCTYGPRSGGSRKRKNRLLELETTLVNVLLECDAMDDKTADYICLGYE